MRQRFLIVLGFYLGFETNWLCGISGGGVSGVRARFHRRTDCSSPEVDSSRDLLKESPGMLNPEGILSAKLDGARKRPSSAARKGFVKEHT